MPPYAELRKTNHFYYFIKFTLNIYSMLFSVRDPALLSIIVITIVLSAAARPSGPGTRSGREPPHQTSFAVLTFDK